MPLPFGDRVALIAKRALTDGPIGNTQEREFWAKFASCGFSPSLTTGDGIETLFSSCGVFARACLHWAGRPSARPGRIGQPLFGGWLEGLTPWSKSWQRAAENLSIPVGAIFYREYTLSSNGYMGHVGVVVERTDGGLYVVAEGGGGPDGTMCRLSKPRDIWERDSLNRYLLGWWKPDAMGANLSYTPGCPLRNGDEIVDEVTVDLPATIRRGDGIRSSALRDEVRLWQSIIDVAVDGKFGPVTEGATIQYQREHGLSIDGVVGPQTWGYALKTG